MPDLRDYVNRKVDDRFRVIDEKLKNSFQAIKVDIGSIKSSLKEKKEPTKDAGDKLSKELEEIKTYFEKSVSNLKKELGDKLEKSNFSEIGEIKKEISNLRSSKKKDSSEEDTSKFRKIILAWKEKYKRRKSYEKYFRSLKEKEIAELKKKEYEKSKEKARLEREHQKKLEELKEREYEEAKEKARIEREHQRQLEDLERKHREFEETIINKSREVNNIYSRIISKSEKVQEEQRERVLEELKRKENEESREKARIEREHQNQIEELDKKHKEFEERIIDRAKDLDKLYSGVLSKEQRKFEEQRKKDLGYLEEIKYEEYKEKSRIERDYQRKLEEQKEREIAIIKQKSALERLEKDPKLRKFQTALSGERKFFFSLLFIGLLILSIFSLFKSPLDFPGLTEKAFWSLMILSSIIMLYYLRVFDFLSKVDSLRSEQAVKKEEISQPTTRNDYKKEKVKIVINGNKHRVYKREGWVSRIVDSLAD